MPTSFPSPIRIQGSVDGAVPGTGPDVDIYSVNADPTGTLDAPSGSLAIDGTNKLTYQNTSAGLSGTTWTALGAGGGGGGPEILFASSADAVIENTTTAAVFPGSSYTIPANSLAVGDRIVVYAQGSLITNSMQNLWFTLGLGGQFYSQTLGLTTGGFAGTWQAEVGFQVKALGAGGVATINTYTNFTQSNSAGFAGNVISTNFDTTATNVVGLGGDFDTAAIQNVATLQVVQIIKYPAP